jgi:hypothetical protein
MTPLGLILAGLVGVTPTEATTGTNVPIELTFEARREHADPFHTVTLDVVFTAPDGATRRVPAFWAGGDRWKVRYAAPEVGEHRWRSICDPGDDAGLHGVEGVVRVAPYEGDNVLYRHGPLRVASDRRYLEHADGTPFFWLGDTWWMGLCHRLTWPEEFRTLTADRVAKGFNVVQIVMGLYPDMPAFDPRGANESGFPWTEDYTTIRPEYFDRADERLNHLVENGITPCLVGAWGYHLPWMGQENAKRHWRYLVARYGAWPVVWCAAGEANLPYYQAKGFPYDDREQVRGWTPVLRYIRETDPFRRPLTIHPTAINKYTARHATDDPALLDFDMLQTPHGERPAALIALKAMRESCAAEPTMPVINGEAAYEMLLDKIPARWTRAMFWICLTNGAAGHTYGANGIWQCNRKDRPHGPSPHGGDYGKITWDEAMRLPGSSQLAAAKRFLERWEWWRFTPHPEWVAWASEGDPELPPQATGIAEDVRVVWVPDRQPVVLSSLSAGRAYRLTRFDPSEGTMGESERLVADAGGRARIDPPRGQDDWVVAVEPAER